MAITNFKMRKNISLSHDRAKTLFTELIRGVQCAISHKSISHAYAYGIKTANMVEKNVCNISAPNSSILYISKT